MASFNPKVFIRPDGLKRIANVHLIDLLEPWREYFAGREFVFPTDPKTSFRTVIWRRFCWPTILTCRWSS